MKVSRDTNTSIEVSLTIFHLQLSLHFPVSSDSSARFSSPSGCMFHTLFNIKGPNKLFKRMYFPPTHSQGPICAFALTASAAAVPLPLFLFFFFFFSSSTTYLTEKTLHIPPGSPTALPPTGRVFLRVGRIHPKKCLGHRRTSATVNLREIPACS